MSAYEPGGTAELEPAPPRFRVVMRGYDRHHVDAVVAELIQQLTEERRRLEDVELAFQQLELETRSQEKLSNSFAGLGAEAAKVFEEAGTAANDLLAEAARRAQAIIAAAETTAAAVIRTAEERAAALEQEAQETLADAQFERSRLELEAGEAADEVKARAEQDAGAIVAEANAQAEDASAAAANERAVVEAEIKRLRTLREFIGGQLKQMQTELGRAIAGAEAEAEAEAEAKITATDEETPAIEQADEDADSEDADNEDADGRALDAAGSPAALPPGRGPAEDKGRD